MNEQDNVEVVKDSYIAIQRGHIPALLECLTSDIKWFAIGPPGLIPTAGTRYGRNQVSQYFATISATEDVEKFQPEEFIAEADKVVVIGTLQSRIRKTGGLIQTPWVHIFNLRSGKISEFRSFYDSAASVEARLNMQELAATAR